MVTSLLVCMAVYAAAAFARGLRRLAARDRGAMSRG